MSKKTQQLPVPNGCRASGATVKPRLVNRWRASVSVVTGRTRWSIARDPVAGSRTPWRANAWPRLGSHPAVPIAVRRQGQSGRTTGRAAPHRMMHPSGSCGWGISMTLMMRLACFVVALDGLDRRSPRRRRNRSSGRTPRRSSRRRHISARPGPRLLDSLRLLHPATRRRATARSPRSSWLSTRCAGFLPMPIRRSSPRTACCPTVRTRAGW